MVRKLAQIAIMVVEVQHQMAEAHPVARIILSIKITRKAETM